MIRQRGNSMSFDTYKGNNQADKVGDEQIQRLGRPITDLPRSIIVNILLKLSVRRIIVCKSVCKIWCDIISNPQFAKLHFARAEICPLVRTLDYSHVSRTVYLVEPSELDHHFKLGCCIRDPDYFRCDTSIKMKLDTKFKIPVRNAEIVFNSEGDGKLSPTNCGVKRKRCLKLKPQEHKFKIVNSCNGFLCLSEPLCSDTVVVCNPVTGEYVNLPVAKVAENAKYFIECGLGFSPRTNKYKVIRMFDQRTDQCSLCPFTSRLAEIHIMGTRSWRSIGHAPYPMVKLAFPTYLHGALHWLLNSDCRSEFIISFDFDDEQFQSVPLPFRKGDCFAIQMHNLCMGVLRDCLCICDSSDYEYINIWMMREYGVKGSWTKEVSISIPIGGRWPCGLYQPLDYLNNGAVLMFHYPKNALIYYNPETGRHKYLKFHGIKSKFEAIAHIPSFVSLKDAVMGDDAAVFNVKSRCAEMKLQGEARALFLMEEDRKKRWDWD